MSHETDPNSQSFLELFSKVVSLGSNPTMTIPKIEKMYLDAIPQFDGEPKVLKDFLSVCNGIVLNFYDTSSDTSPQNWLILSHIKAKIIGDAKIKLANHDLSSWEKIKRALLDTYADKRDLGTLTKEMYQISQVNETAFDFVQRLEQHLYLINAYLDTHGRATDAPLLKETWSNLATKQALDGMKNPLQQYVKARKPSSLSQIYNILMNEYQEEASCKNFMTVSVPASNNHENMQNSNKPRPNYSKPFKPNANPNPVFRSQFNERSSKLTSTQQNRAHQQNYRDFATKPSGGNNFPTNTPIQMSGISRNSHSTTAQKFNLEAAEHYENEMSHDNEDYQHFSESAAEYAEEYTDGETHTVENQVFRQPASTILNPS